VALALVDAALLLAPERPESRVTRALLGIQLGRREDALADAALLPDGSSESRAFLETYARVIFPAFAFTPGATEIDQRFADVPPGPEQPLPAVRAHVQKYATRIGQIRAAVRARLAGPAPDWLPPDLAALLPDGPCALAAWDFEEVVDDGADAGPSAPTRVAVDERLPSLDGGIPSLMRLARREWNALCWLCWSAGLDRVALPEALNPPAAFGQAAVLSVERLWRCRDKLTTAGLRALTQKIPGFAWEGIEIDALPAVLVEIAGDEYLEMRALFYWLCDAGVQSPWQDNLRGES
jgi:hypothetical protein